MKIGIVSPYYMHIYGGVQTLILEMQRLLTIQGHEIVIIAPKPKLKADIDKTPVGIVLLGKSVEINFKNPFHTHFPLAASNRPTIADFLNQQKFDLLNIHEPWMPFLSYQILQETICPVVGTTHARWPRSWFNKSLEKIRMPYFKNILNQLDYITAVSNVAAQNINLFNGSFQYEIIPNGIDLKNFQTQIKKARKNNSKPYILYLNRLEKRKGPKLLLKAYKNYLVQTQSEVLPLKIAGSGPQLDTLKTYVQKHNLNKFVSFEGYVSHQHKMELFANATVYVSPAPFGESFGIVLLEAMAALTPIVAGYNEGYQTVLKDFGRKSLVNPYKVRRFALALDQFCNNQSLRSNWQKWAKDEILKYDYPKIIGQYERCFKIVYEKK